MASFKKYSPYIFATIGIFAVFFATRLFNLLSLPIFTDEAIYLRWAQIANNDPNWRFISLTDGKQPLFIWITMVAMRIFEDPLFAGRFVSVMSGFITTIGLFFLGREIFKNTAIGFITASIYVLYPFALIYDRMALYDSIVAMFSVWITYFSILLVRLKRLDVAMILGMVTGLSVLNKSNGFFGIYLLPFSLLLVNLKEKKIKEKVAKWVGLAAVATVITYAMYSILRLSPWFYMIDQKNTTFVYPLREWLSHPFQSFWGNLQGELTWLVTYLTISGVVLVLGAFVVDRKYILEKFYLFLLFCLPFIALAVFGRVIYPRYILFMTMALLPLAAYTLYRLYELLSNKKLFWLTVFLMSLLPLRAIFFIHFDFEKAPIPVADVGQYKTGWPSGEGVRESIDYLEQQSKNQKIYLATQGTFGLMPYAYELYFYDNPNVEIKGYWPIKDSLPQEVVEASKQMPTYFVFYQPCSSCMPTGEAPESWEVEEVMRIPKGAGEIDFRLYKVKYDE